MKLDLVKGIGSLTEFARNTRTQVEELQKTNQPRVLTQNGKAAAVVLSVEAYEEMAQLAYEREMDLRLSKAVEAYAQGERGTDATVVFERLQKQLG
jgi:prevent-host-death family protein